MTELRPLIAFVGLAIVAVAILVAFARARGWRPAWWERFLSPGRARGPGTASAGAPGAGRGARHGAARPAPTPRDAAGTGGPGRSGTPRRAKASGGQALIDLDDLPMFNPRERPRAASLDREFDVGDLGAIESESGDSMRPRAHDRRQAPGPSAPPSPPPRRRRSGARRGGDRRDREASPRRAAGEVRRAEAEEADPPAAAGRELIVVLTIFAADERELQGPLIRDALAAFDLQPDEQGMFHHYGNRRGATREPVFSVADVLDPGVFDVDAMDALATPGLCLFMRRPGPLPASVAFDLMLDVGTRLSRALEATLCDDHRCRLTVQATQALRERVVHFALRNERGAPDER